MSPACPDELVDNIFMSTFILSPIHGGSIPVYNYA